MTDWQAPEVVAVDIETYSGTDIRNGLANYFDDDNYRPLLVAVAKEVEEGIAVIVVDFCKVPMEQAIEKVQNLIGDSTIVAHNAMFEFAALHKMGLNYPTSRFVDSAVVARVAGMGGSLEAAAPQALNSEKLESGKKLIQLFSIPGTYQMENGTNEFDATVIDEHPGDWTEFAEYCGKDAALSLQLLMTLAELIDDHELVYSSLTMDMNVQGWTVDVELVEQMQRRYDENLAETIAEFRADCDEPDLNLSSSQQMIAWCKERGVRATSFDEQHVAKMMEKVGFKLDTMAEDDPKRAGYEQVMHLLHTKKEMGGSSLKKLRTILTQVARDGKLYDQYLHAGAGQTLRTTGRGVQLQNLARLNGKPDDVTELFDPGIRWDNRRMARNLRQVFTASDPKGLLIVGDLSAVESRGLAWQAGETWKLEAYREGRDVYREQGARFFGIPTEQAVAADRTFGKVGELSCGYQAGWEAVKSFAEKMDVHLSEGEAKKLVSDFRTTNPSTVAYWHALQAALDQAMEMGMAIVALPHGRLGFSANPAPPSLRKQTGNDELKTVVVRMQIPLENGERFEMTRIFHGVYRDGRSLFYYKPSERKTGDLWVPDYTDPKTGARRNYSLYGGKLAGILTQSMCREVFMNSLWQLAVWLKPTSNVRIQGQFHDEVVLDWAPPSSVLDLELDETIAGLKKIMSWEWLPGLTLAAEVKSDYRYTK